MPCRTKKVYYSKTCRRRSNAKSTKKGSRYRKNIIENTHDTKELKSTHTKNKKTHGLQSKPSINSGAPEAQEFERRSSGDVSSSCFLYNTSLAAS